MECNFSIVNDYEIECFPCKGLWNECFTCKGLWNVSLVKDYGMPMRMSYSAITDPCLSQEVLQQIDKVKTSFPSKSETFTSYLNSI